MKKNTIFAVLIFTVLSSLLFARPSKNEYSSKLLPLVGKKITLTLKNGKVSEGTLWDFEADSLTLKIKKSLLYSQSVKYGMNELDFLNDENGTKVSFAKDAKPTAIFFSMDDVKTADNQTENTQLAEDTGIQIITKTKTDSEPLQAAADTEPQEAAPVVKKVNITRPEVQKEKPQVAVMENKPVAPKQQSQIRGKIDEAGSLAAIKSPAKKEVIVAKNEIRENKHAVKQTKASPIANTTKTAKIQEDEAAPADKNTEDISYAGSKEVLVLRYQLLILFAVVSALAIIMIIAKTIGLKGSTYGKYTLFPAKLIKLQSNYGIIDQGTADGVKIDDIIRFYSKTGKKIDYRGQVKVKKVGETESAVEILKVKNGQRLEIGDVGFRDHNLLATAMKKLRVLTSVLLNLLGKTILYTAKNIEVKESQLDVELDSETKVTVVNQVIKNVSKEPVSLENSKTLDFKVEK